MNRPISLLQFALMRFLSVFVLLVASLCNSQQPISKHVPADYGAQQSRTNPHGKPLPTVAVDPPIDKAAPANKNHNDEAPANNGIKTVEVIPQSDIWFKSYVISSIVIALINLGVLFVIWRQRTEMEQQRGIMRDQLTAMQGQILEMRNAREDQFQANTQQSASTAHIIGQAARQADALYSLVSATSKSAAAAASNVLALMNAERAWIMAEIQWRTNMHVVKHSGGLSLDIFLLYQNDGKTPAWIMEVRILFRIIDARPVKPLYGTGPGDFAISGPIPVTIGEAGKIKAWLQCEGIQEEKTLLVYGFIKYRDIFSPDRETRFGYTVNQSGFNRISEIGDSWHYNGYT